VTSRRLDGSIGPDFVVHGKLSGKSDLRIDGIFEGEIDVRGAISVGPASSVNASLRVGSLEIEGEVRGNVAATEEVMVRAGGRLIGDVSARQIGIDDGGSLQGGIDMEFELPASEDS